MPSLEPVDYDPFAGLQPVDYDPWDGRPMPSTYAESKMDAGPRVPGNIDLTNRPVVRNPDGSISTVRSIDVALDGGKAVLGGPEANPRVLIPTISDDGRALSDRDAVDLYNRTGRHLGKFDTSVGAGSYAQRLHEDQAKLYARYALEPVDYDPFSGAPAPSSRAQEKFNKIADAVVAGAKNWIETPGRAMQEGITTDQAVNWAAPMALGMVGAPGVPSGATLGSSMRFKSVPELSEHWTGQGVRNFIADRPTRNQLQVSDLVVPKEQRGQGVGSSFMEDVARLADEQGKTVTLTPDASYGATSVGRLKDFYKRFGFVENKGRNADPAISDSMYRLPNVGTSGKEPTFGSGANDTRTSAANLLIAQGSQPEGIRAYHGSPHDFDRFDLNKIGTGEGAQAYGHGLYFAENKATAADYKKKLSGPFSKAVDNEFIRSASGELPLTAEHMGTLRHFAADENLLALDAAKRLQWRFPELRDPGMQGQGGDFHRGLAAAIEQTRNTGKGRMYEVNIGAKPEQFLDWDKPLSQQGEPARKALNDIWGLPSPESQSTMTGSDVYRTLASARGGERPMGGGQYSVPYTNEPRVTAEMREAGIPGIRYLDQGSRVDPHELATWRQAVDMYSKSGDPKLAVAQRTLADLERRSETGSRNYVVFSPEIIQILRKYGLAGGVALGAASLPDEDKQ